MPVISFANTKGGSGKTTSSLLLAHALAERKPTTIIDADPRNPITAWKQLGGVPENLTVVTSGGENNILDEIDEASARDPFVLIDLEGTASKLMSYALSMSDLVVIPLKEQQQDATAALDVIREIQRTSKASRRPIPFSLLFTQTRAAVKSRTARHISAQFRENPSLHTFTTEINERDAFAAIFSIGGTVRDMDQSKVNGIDKALANIDAFTHEIIATLRENGRQDTGVERAAS